MKMTNKRQKSKLYLRQCKRCFEFFYSTQKAKYCNKCKLPSNTNGRPRIETEVKENGRTTRDRIAVSYTHLTLPTTPYV